MNCDGFCWPQVERHFDRFRIGGSSLVGHAPLATTRSVNVRRKTACRKFRVGDKEQRTSADPAAPGTSTANVKLAPTLRGQFDGRLLVAYTRPHRVLPLGKWTYVPCYGSHEAVLISSVVWGSVRESRFTHQSASGADTMSSSDRTGAIKQGRAVRACLGCMSMTGGWWAKLTYPNLLACVLSACVVMTAVFGGILPSCRGTVSGRTSERQSANTEL